MKLVNFSNSEDRLKWFDSQWHCFEQCLGDHGLDGMELIVNSYDDLHHIPKDLIKGLHLRYWPTWLEFWEGDLDKVRHMLSGDDEIIKAHYGGLDRNALINHYKKEYKVAKELEVKYMVFHVSHVTIEDAFKLEFDYTDEQVLKATAELVNASFDEDSDVDLLFENLWWPGLTLLKPELVKSFMDSINYKNKGIMLDLSHLIATNPNIHSVEQATEYILQCIEKLGPLKEYIKGIHINKSIPGGYLLEDHSHKYLSVQKEEDELQKYLMIMDHIKSIDMHLPYDHESLMDIIDVVQPKYKVIEILADDRNQWESYIVDQNKYFSA